MWLLRPKISHNSLNNIIRFQSQMSNFHRHVVHDLQLARIELVSTVVKRIVDFLPEGEQLTIAVDGIGKQQRNAALIVSCPN